MGRSGTTPGTAYIALLASLLVSQLYSAIATATTTQQTGNEQPLLVRKQDADVLLMECQVPLEIYVKFNNWRLAVNLQILYKAHSAHAEMEKVAQLASSSTKPTTIGRFNEVDMLQTENRVYATGAKNTCQVCRRLSLRMPVYETELGDYFCKANMKRQSITYTITVDDKFVRNSKSVSNGSFTAKSVKAHEISLTWNDAAVHVSRLGKVIVERTVVDANTCPIEGMAPTIIFETVKDVSEPYEEQGTLLYNKTGPTSQGQSVVRLFVKTDTLCFPNCLYSCEVSRKKCKGEAVDLDACAPKAEPQSVCPDNNRTVVALAVACGVIPCLLLVVFVFCWKRRGSDPVITANSHAHGTLSDIVNREDSSADGYRYGGGYAEVNERGAFNNPGFALAAQEGAVTDQGAVTSQGGDRQNQAGANLRGKCADEGVGADQRKSDLGEKGASSRNIANTNYKYVCTDHEYALTKEGYVCTNDDCGSTHCENAYTNEEDGESYEKGAYTSPKYIESEDEDDDFKKEMRDAVEHQETGTTQIPSLIDF